MNKYYAHFPVKDAIEHIGSVLESLINQSLPPSKIVIVDDGSVDGTSDVLKQYKEKYPNLIQVIRNESTTRDFARIPHLWNKALQTGYEYQMVAAGDVTYEKDYAKKIIEKMEENDLVIASGDYEPFTANAPHGAGRFIKQSFFDLAYPSGKYSTVLGYETEMLTRVSMNNMKYKLYNGIVFNHLDKLGHSHNFVEWGYGMKSLGYHPIWVLGRCVSVAKTIGLKSAITMFKSYLTYKSGESNYYSYLPEDVRAFTRKEQIDKIKRILSPVA